MAFTILILICIALLLNKFTGGIIFRYLNNVKSRTISTILLIIQCTTSVLLAIILPNNFLVNHDSFLRLYNDNQLWIPVSMGVILYTSLAILGFLFGLIIKDKTFKEKQQ